MTKTQNCPFNKENNLVRLTTDYYDLYFNGFILIFIYFYFVYLRILIFFLSFVIVFFLFL